MTRLPFLLLGLLAAALSGVILLGLDPGVDEAGLPQPAPRRAAPSAAGGAAAGAAETPSGQLDGWVSTVLARPLLSPDRRPAPPGDAAAPAAGAALPRLTGTLVTPSGRSAIFAGGAAPLVLQEGGRVGAFTVMRIEAGQVMLAGPDGVRVLGPRFDPERRAAPPAEGAAAPPAPLPPPSQAPGAGPAAGRPPAGLPPIPGGAAPPPGAPAIVPSPGEGGAAEGAAPFEQNAAPSGADILRNADRNSQSTAPGGTR